MIDCGGDVIAIDPRIDFSQDLRQTAEVRCQFVHCLNRNLALLRHHGPDACPKFNAKVEPDRFGAMLPSTISPVAGDKSLTGIDVVFPFPSCDAWLKRKAERKRF